ncbi:MAG TPA: hypothetical protein VJ743_15030, partial [Albitalea sp.]|nr:hypothetical protein [Albitalea sp.]
MSLPLPASAPAALSPQRRALVVVLVCAALAWALPVQARTPAPPRSAAVRGPLSGEELNNIAVFKSASPSVVNITALGLERELFSMNVQQVPRGTGTG